MVTVGIICEYNPFHNGHLYQINKARGLFGEDCAVVAIMSGNFVQRGEVALLDKWTRARSALLCGVNLVIELPVVYATGSAERFADGGVALIAATGICDYLVFGSESGDLTVLDRLAETLAYEPADYQKHLKSFLDQGFSFPISRIKALNSYDPSFDFGPLLGSSNNILAVEYLKAIKRRNIINTKPYTIKREGQDYRDSSHANSDVFWSASAIRASIVDETIDISGKSDIIELHNANRSIPVAPVEPVAINANRNVPVATVTTGKLLFTLCNAMPVAALSILADKFHNKECMTSQEDFADIIFAQLRAIDLETLSGISGMNEGLAARLKEFAKKIPGSINRDIEYTKNNKERVSRDLDGTENIKGVNSRAITDNDFSHAIPGHPSGLLEALIDNVTTKRHPKSRIARALTHMLLGIRNSDLELFDLYKGPLYLRILGFDKKGQYLLKLMKKTATLPILMKGSDFLEYANNEENMAFRRMAELDCIATDIWMLKFRKPFGQDFTTPPISFLRSPKQ